jgi:hypothetical protein
LGGEDYACTGTKGEKYFFDGGKSMKKSLVILVFLLLPTPLWAAVGFNVTIGAPGFYLSIGNFYGYPEREVVVCHERGIPDDDIPVVFFICKHAHVDPEVIIRLRVVEHWPWSRICTYYRIPPTAFYFPVEKYGPPYGHAYGYYGRYPHRGDWGKIRLREADIVNQVNLIFVSKYYNYPPERVIRMREQGTSFGTIERKVYREREYQARGGVSPREVRKPGPPPEVRRPQAKVERMPGPPSKVDIPPQGVRAPHARFQDVYPSIPHPSQRPEVKGGYAGPGGEKGKGRGHGKKD